METGAITEYIDVAQVTLYVFWIFFAGLVFYLQRESRREGYPVEADTTGKLETLGEIYAPPSKTFKTKYHGDLTQPSWDRDAEPEHAVRYDGAPGGNYEPTGNPLLSNMGPAAYANRMDSADVDMHGNAKIQPMRKAKEFAVAEGDPNPVGMPVVGVDKRQGGTVTDVWVDIPEQIIRYLEVETERDGKKRKVLLPMTFCVVRSNPKQIYVNAIQSHQFADVPGTKKTTEVTMLEEDKICGYYGGGMLYAFDARKEPLV